MTGLNLTPQNAGAYRTERGISPTAAAIGMAAALERARQRDVSMSEHVSAMKGRGLVTPLPNTSSSRATEPKAPSGPMARIKAVAAVVASEPSKARLGLALLIDDDLSDASPAALAKILARTPASPSSSASADAVIASVRATNPSRAPRLSNSDGWAKAVAAVNGRNEAGAPSAPSPDEDREARLAAFVATQILGE